MTTRDDEQSAKLQEIGKRAFESIAEMVAALECDYDRLEELRADRKTSAFAAEQWDEEYPDKIAELVDLEKAAGDCKDRDDAEQRIHEDPLCVEVREDWHNPHNDAEDGPCEFRILLGTGGPATRIIGELNEHGEPTSAKLQAQDWFTQWTDYREGDEETLLTYCRCFYFGEG